MDILVSMRNRKAFTLVELLTVMAVIAILAAITFGISAGVYERQARTKAQAELSSLASALEAYRSEHGAYPEAPGTDWNANAVILFDALTGQIEPDGDAITPRGRAFVDISKYDLETEGSDGDIPDESRFLDPWGNPYAYQYDPDPASWERFGFVLYSPGPDGDDVVPENGISDKDAEDNADNIYLNN